jgi:hypothetical protein
MFLIQALQKVRNNGGTGTGTGTGTYIENESLNMYPVVQNPEN